MLHTIYARRCHWCGRLKDFADIETDHMIPKTLKGRAPEEAPRQLGLARNFDLNDSANLAQICRRCNGAAVKVSLDMTSLPIVASHLRKAQRIKPEVHLGDASSPTVANWRRCS